MGRGNCSLAMPSHHVVVRLSPAREVKRDLAGEPTEDASLEDSSLRATPSSGIDVPAKSDTLSDMKKPVSVAEFTKQFGPITNELAPGESVQVTSYGEVHGRYVREGLRRRRRKFDLGKRLSQEPYSAKVGQQLVDAILSEV